MSTSDELKPADSQKSASRILLATWITVTNILALGSLVFWASIVLCALMSYPPEEKGFSYYFYTVVMYAYPLIIASLVIFTWNAYKKGRDLTAWVTSIVSILPVLWLLLEIFNVI